MTDVEELERQIYDLRQLVEISKSLNSTLNYESLIESILFTCVGQMRALKVGLFARRGLDDSQFALHRKSVGFDPALFGKRTLSNDNPAVRLLHASPRCYSPEELLAATGGVVAGVESLLELDLHLVVPLRSRGILTGILVFGPRLGNEPFSEQDRDFIMDIGALAAIAIHNSFLFEMATTDMMTGLRLKHYFETALADEMERARENGTSLAIMILDLDFFKVLNDSYGHVCGDLVLKQVARIILDGVRQKDTAARYGGEEFTILLPQAKVATAMRVAERLRAAVEGADVDYDGKRVTTTVSIGVAGFRLEVDTRPSSFIRRADEALYASKNAGRNRVTLAS